MLPQIFIFFKSYNMETDKTKTEDKEPYQNIYEQYYHFNIEWHNWQRYIGGVITANGANCEYIKSQLSELERYMLDSILGGKWYEHNCPNLMENKPKTTGFLFWWKQRYMGNLNPVGDTTNKVDECNTFFFNYSKWQYLKSLFADTEPQQIGIPKELQTDEAKSIFEKAVKAKLMVSTETGCYQWQKSTALLAYMCGRLFCGDRVKYIAGEDVIQKGSDYFPETALNQLFQTKNLGQSHQQLKDKRPPRGHECVDDLF
jgi:hypothetical protein